MITLKMSYDFFFFWSWLWHVEVPSPGVTPAPHWCPDHCSDNIRSLTHWSTRELQSYNFYICILGPHPWHMEVPRLGIYLELQLPAYVTATAMQNPSHACKLHHSSWQHWILNPVKEARDQTCILMDPSQVCYWAKQKCLLSYNFLFYINKNGKE